jgi:hypothetical protein
MTPPVKLEHCPVTDEDRQAAAALVRTGAPGLGNGNGNKAIASEIVGKLHDDYAVVQAFARHRATHQASRIADEGIVSDSLPDYIDIFRIMRATGSTKRAVQAKAVADHLAALHTFSVGDKNETP